MKTVSNKFSLFCRLGTMAIALLLGQQAFAIGTDAGLSVTNTTSAVYSVGGNPQPAAVSNAADFVVDRRVDFTLSPVIPAHEIVSPDNSPITFDFTLQNDSNSEMDFAVTFNQLALGADVNGNLDTGADVPGAVLATVFVDNLAEDTFTTITLNGIADNTLANLDIANIEVVVTALDPISAGLPGTALVDTSGIADDPGEIDNVLADAGNDGVESAFDGIIVESADVTVTKSSSVRYDPINGVNANAKAIPGAVIEYLITVDNTAGVVDATNLVINDAIDPLVQFVNAANNPEVAAEPYGGGNVDFGAGASVCFAESGVDTNGDGCWLTGADLTISGVDLVGNPINVAAGASLEIRFRVLVPALP